MRDEFVDAVLGVDADVHVNVDIDRCIQLEWRVPILAIVLDARELLAILMQNGPIKEQTCPSVTPNSVLTHSSNRL